VSRVLVGEPALPAEARAALECFTVEAAQRPRRGPDVVALLATDRQQVGEDDLARLRPV
jgi:hypothetical protein